jgi:GTP-binding protein HflX
LSDKIHGSLQGIGAAVREGLQRLHRHATQPDELIGETLALRMCALAAQLHRQIGVLIDRRGHVAHVVVGDDHQIVLPDLGRHGQGRLRGLRLVHVHLRGELLSDDDLNDLTRLHLDLAAVLTLRGELPDRVQVAHLSPEIAGLPHRAAPPHTVLPLARWADFRLDVVELLRELEVDLGRTRPATRIAQARAQALCIHVGPEPLAEAEDRLDELEELCRTARVEVVGRVIQRRQAPDPKTLIGTGKLAEIAGKAVQTDANLLVLASELTPSQSKSISQQADMRVVDRTQLILDIFARRARSQDGKLQVELAQLRYSLPRLKDRDNALSRLTGGIGGQGPGETKLELDRRRARDRIHRLEQELQRLERGRATRRRERLQQDVPTATLCGYTNVGKSSLLNALAKSDVFTENLLFATLDPTSRRIRLPAGTNCVITDTVGFIRDLPKELEGAFAATLEEARAADLIVVVLDASHAQVEQQHASVLQVLAARELGDKPRLTVINKCDAVRDPPTLRELAARTQAVQTSSLTRLGLPELMTRLEQALHDARAAAGALREHEAAEALAAQDEWTPHD